MKDPRLQRAGVSGFNKPKRTPSHKTKSHVVVKLETKLKQLDLVNKVLLVIEK